MGMKEIQLGLLALATAAAFAGESHLRREGAFWVEVEKGSEQVAARGNIQISTVGGVSIKGAPGNQLSYTVVKRVKARNEAQARRLLSAYSIRLSRQGEQTSLVVQGGWMADLEVMAPQDSIWPAGEIINLSHQTMWRGLLGSQVRRFFQITKRIRVLASLLMFHRDCDSGSVKKVRRTGILRIELMCVAERLIRCILFA